MKMSSFVLLVSLFGLSLNVAAEVEIYQIDNNHSVVRWKVRHVVAKTIGTFSNLTGTIAIDRDKMENSKVETTINVFSLSSNHQERDVHVLGSDFLEATKFKQMTFVSTSVTPTGKDSGILKGQLTLHGVTKDIEFPFEILGFGEDPWGGFRSGFEAHTTLKRSDFNINWGLDMPNGGPIGNEVEVTLLIEGIKVNADGRPWKKTTEKATPTPEKVTPAPEKATPAQNQ